MQLPLVAQFAAGFPLTRLADIAAAAVVAHHSHFESCFGLPEHSAVAQIDDVLLDPSNQNCVVYKGLHCYSVDNYLGRIHMAVPINEIIKRCFKKSIMFYVH